MTDNGKGIVSGKLALVTGAASGIGRGTCQVLAREGATIAAVDINKEGLEDLHKQLPGSGHEVFVTDVSSYSDVSDLARNVKVKFGGRVPNVVVCCAGINIFELFVEAKEEDYDRLMAVNLKGTFLVMQTMGRCMIENEVKDGSVIAISSVVGKVGFEELGPYSATKAGQTALIKTAAKEWAKIPIRCNYISPGTISTAMAENAASEHIREVIGLTPMGRQGTPEEVGQAILFLASDRSSFITGADIPVTGGMFM